MNIITRSSLLILLACMLGGVPNPVQADTKVVTTSGVAMAGAEGSRREAVEDALRNAVEEAMGTYVSVDLMVENKQIINENILSQTSGYIQNYKVLDEENKGGLYRVKIQATVRLGKIRDDLSAAGLLMQRKQLPRLMVVVTSPTPGEAWVEGKQYVDSVKNVVEQVFLKKKFRLVDYDRHAVAQQAAAMQGDAQKLASLAKDAGAEVIVHARAARYFERDVNLYGSNYKLYRSDVQLRIVESGTGRVIYSGTQAGEGSATLDPLHDAAKLVAAQGMEALLQKWSGDVSGTAQIKLNVRNLDFAGLRQLEQAIRAIHGVKGLQRRGFATGNANLDIEFRGNADKLVDRLSEISAPKISITGFNPQSIDAEIRP